MNKRVIVLLDLLLLEIVAVIIGFGIAAELIAIGTEKLEPLIGQGMAGGVVLGLIGALPETLFVVIATYNRSYDVALGSALGGNIILFTLGIGAIGIIYTLKWKKNIFMKDDYKIEVRFLLFSTLVMIALLIYGSLNIISGSLLLLIYVAYLVYRYKNAKRMLKESASTVEGRKIIVKGLAYLALGTLIVLALSSTFVSLITNASATLGISALWLALVISPIAADMDENLSAYRLATRSPGGGSTAIVSFIGSKLQNNTMLIGLIGIISYTSVSIAGARFEFITVIAINIVAMYVIMRGKITYVESSLLIAAYVAVIIATLIL